MQAYTSRLPQALYTCEQTRQLDKLATDIDGIPGIVLMKRAGRAAFDFICEEYPDIQHVLIFCGAGNNAGDGYVIGALIQEKLAKEKGVTVEIVSIKDPETLTGDAHRAFRYAKQECVPIGFNQLPETIRENTLVVDALLGTGITGDVSPQYAEVIHWINAQPNPVFSIDIPSGVCGDTGRILGAAVEAQSTLTFIGVKRGLLTHDAVDCMGRAFFAGLGVSDEVYGKLKPSSQRLELIIAKRWLAPRKRNAHKGMSGRVTLIGGDHGYGGAIVMTAQGCARMGAGLIQVVTREEHRSAILLRLPEVMTRSLGEGEKLAPLIERANCLAVGPGLGNTPWSEALFLQSLSADVPKVVDADGLNWLAKLQEPPELKNCVLTPHPGEAARLLGVSIEQIMKDRFASAKRLVEKFQATVILKGAGSIVAFLNDDVLEMRLINAGNPGMASGGMGDVLTGMIAAFIAQGLSCSQAAQLGAILHASAGDEVARQSGEIGILATDLIDPARALLNSLEF